MEDLLNEFLIETNESLLAIEVDLVKLEQSTSGPDLLNNIFRLKQPIKGACSSIGALRFETVARPPASVLGKLSEGGFKFCRRGRRMVDAARLAAAWDGASGNR